jgi:Fe-S-cluster containining protein
MLNPWELVCLAREKKITTKEFRDLYCEFGGIRLRFDGPEGWKNLQACSQYIQNYGCSVHAGRPLSCRLYPLGRQIQSEKVYYIYQGKEFPCLEGCPEVTDLPHMSVVEYLNNQLTNKFEKAQDEYLDLMQNLAEIAFVLLLDTDLVKSGDKNTLQLWRQMGNEPPEILADRIGYEWLDCLTLPEISEDLDNPISFIKKHNDLLHIKAQEKFGALQTNQEIHEASVLIMGVALHLGRGIGANPEILVDHWIDTAKGHGALE